MTSLKKYRMSYLVYFVIFFIIASLILYVNELFLVLIIPYVILVNYYTLKIKCTICETPVLPLGDTTMLDKINSFKKTTCKNCGANLD